MKKKPSFIILHLKHYIADLSIYLIFAFCAWGVSFILPYLTGSYIDVLVKSNRKAVVLFTVILFSLNVINLIVGYIYQKALSKLNTNIAFQISFTLYERLKKVNMSFYNNMDTVYLVNRINNDSNAIIAFVTSNIITLITQSLSLILGIGILYHINRVITLVTVLAMPIYILLYKIYRKRMYNVNFDFMERRSEYFAKMTEQFSFIKFIKVHSLYEMFSKRLQKSYFTLFQSLMRYFKVNYLFINANSLIMSIVGAFTFFYGGLSVINGNISIGQYAIINVYFNIIIQALKYFLEFGKNYQETCVSYKRLLELYNINTEENGDCFLQTIHCIKVKQLSFYYQATTKPILEHFNVEFNRGNLYTLVGKNGAGKTTFINILLGLYNDLYEGEILFNDKELKKLNMYDLRKKLIATTEQEPVLLNAGIYENLISSTDNKSKLQEYCKKFNIEYLFNNGSNSKKIKLNLSGGEKQKLTIVRTLMKDSPVMIFDEPTSALDEAGIELLKSILLDIKKNKIIIVITHDNRLVGISDQTVEF